SSEPVSEPIASASSPASSASPAPAEDPAAGSDPAEAASPASPSSPAEAASPSSPAEPAPELGAEDAGPTGESSEATEAATATDPEQGPTVRRELETDALVRDLADRLWRLGLLVESDFGLTSDRIELALGHPDLPGHLLLAVDTDGARYVATASQRERDRLRAERLEAAGWATERVWSWALVLDPAGEAARLRRAADRGPGRARAAVPASRSTWPPKCAVSSGSSSAPCCWTCPSPARSAATRSVSDRSRRGRRAPGEPPGAGGRPGGEAPDGGDSAGPWPCGHLLGDRQAHRLGQRARGRRRRPGLDAATDPARPGSRGRTGVWSR